MAPRPVITVGIQPQIAIWSVILTGVCAYGWYTERYQRDEDDIDGHIKRLYQEDAREAQTKTSQMMSTIRGQALNVDGRMDRMVWGGKAKLNNGNTSFNKDKNSDDEDGRSFAGTGATVINNNNENKDESDHDKTSKRRRKRRKKRQQKIAEVIDEDGEERKRTEELQNIERKEQKMLINRSSVAGLAVGVITMAAVSVFFSGSSYDGERRKK